MKNNVQNKKVLSWIWTVSGKRKINIVYLLMVQVLLGISSLGFVWLLREMIDQAVAGEKKGFFVGSAMLVGLVAIQISFQAVNRFLAEYTRATMENCFKERLFSSLLAKDYASVTAVHSGEWMNRLTSDTVIVSEGLSLILPGVAGMLVKLFGALILIFTLIPQIGYLIIPGGATMIALTYIFRKVLKKLHKQVQEADGRLRVFFQERLGSLLIVRSFAREQQTLEEAVQKMSDHQAARMKKNRFSNICNVGFGGVMYGIYLLSAVYCGYGILTGGMSYGTFTAVLQLISQIQSPFANITGFLPKYYAMLASAERLMEAESYEDDCPDGVVSTEEIHRFYKEEFAAIGLKDASFTYLPPVREEKELAKESMPVVIENVDLEIHKGEYVAFTGPSGCGKSTLLKLLMCLYPLDKGSRYILSTDEENRKLDSRYHRLFAYVPQGNHLMSGSIREIVSFSDNDKQQDEEAIWHSLTIACADGFVRELRDGIDTCLGERGTGLSEGQMQRIAIARAIFSDNPVLLLDESTSALDEQTEKQLLINLHSMTDKTVLIVTHRPAVLDICDRQVILSQEGIEIRQKESENYGGKSK